MPAGCIRLVARIRAAPMRKRILLTLSFLLVTYFNPASAQQSGVQPEPGSITEGIPSIPSSLVADVGRYTNIRAAEILSWHPVRREMLIATYMCNTPQVYPAGHAHK